MSLRTLPPVAEQIIVPLIRISGVKEDDMSFMSFKRRRGRRRGLFWLSIGACIALFVMGLLLWRPGVAERIVLLKGELRPLIRESWLGWANTRYIFVLYGPGRESP
jgi:hypothetical protein